jgi:hypothetical protein
MTGSRLMHWLLCCLVAAAGVAGCSSDTTSSENTGSLGLSLELADGITINEVDWTLTGNGMSPMSGTIDTSAPGATASVEVFGLPPGDDYLVELEATDESGEITCRGSAPFDVEIGVSTDVMVFLNCKLPARLGGVRVNGKFNICAELAKAVVSPLQTSVGNDIDLAAIGIDVEGDSITYVWSGTGGSIADSNARQTTYTCLEAGQQSITINVSDDDFEYCMDDWTVAVTCVPGEGDLCEDVTCEDDGNDCTETDCNLSTGQCESSDVDDGTQCDALGIGDGICSNGECVDIDLCEDVICDDDNECTDDDCRPADGECVNEPVNDGTDCNGAAGMCLNGECRDIDLCEEVTCDDTGNDCTIALCSMQSGECEEIDVPDGDECNGGNGACSAGECVDNNLCEGVDCSSANDCVQDGTCDPDDGSCIPGDNEAIDTACDGGVCDGDGSCVQCNDPSQCVGDGTQCTATSCEANQCGINNLPNGTDCDFGDAPGTCMAGVCEDAMLCDSVDCGDGNECTADICIPASGMCSNPDLPEGTDCDGGNGSCMSGVCEAADLCENVDCTSGNDCIEDGTCDSGDGSCIPGGDVPAGTACDLQGIGNGVCTGTGICAECLIDAQCDPGDVCVDLTCGPGAIDPPQQTAVLTMGCTNNITADISILPFTLNVDPGPVVGDAIVPVTLGGIAEFSEVFLDAAQGAVPGGVTQADLVNLAATALIRTGGALPANTTLTNAPIPKTCLIPPSNSCDPANDGASVPGSRPNTDCIPTGSFNPCQANVTLPTSNDCAVGGVCDMLGKGPGNAQCDVNGFCVTGGLPLDLLDQNANFQASASGIVNFGWDDQNTGALPLNGDGTYNLPAAIFTAAPTPNEIKVNASGLSVALRCTMAVDSGGPDGVGVPDAASPTPSSLLPTFDIQ